MNIQQELGKAINDLYSAERQGEDLTDKLVLSPTRKEFEGDYTLVVFPLVKLAKKSPEQVAKDIGEKLKESVGSISDYNVIKGFLNISLSNSFWKNQLTEVENISSYNLPAKEEKVLVEFSSPNTNKPLHLGHVRNILLGWSMSCIHEMAGYDVKRVQIINDRGIHICKSMVAWKKYGEGRTPESLGRKGDHVVGD